MAEIKRLLDEVIERELQNLGPFSLYSDEQTEAVKNIAVLHKLRIDEIEAEGKNADRDRDEQLKQRQLREQTIDRYVKIGVATAELVLPLVFYGVWMRKGFKFETTGTYTSGTFKNLFSRFKPTK